jgi:hypothetical protein
MISARTVAIVPATSSTRKTVATADGVGRDPALASERIQERAEVRPGRPGAPDLDHEDVLRRGRVERDRRVEVEDDRRVRAEPVVLLAAGVEAAEEGPHAVEPRVRRQRAGGEAVGG